MSREGRRFGNICSCEGLVEMGFGRLVTGLAREGARARLGTVMGD
jgi:hypothetical protein